MEEEVLVHHEERADAHLALELAHDVEQLVAGLVEVDRLALAAEHGRGGAEVAAQRAAHRRDDRGGHVAAAFFGADAQVPRAEARGNQRVAQRLVLVLAQEAAEPAHALAADDVIGVDPLVQIGHVGDVAADDDRGVRQILPNQLAHLLHFEDVGNDRRDADDVVLVGANLLDEAIERGEVQQRAGRGDVRLDHHQAPTAVEHPQRESALGPRHLVVVKLHRVHAPAAVLVVLAVGPEDARQQHARLRAGRMRSLRMLSRWFDSDVVRRHDCRTPRLRCIALSY